ncbi:hypothetical protein TMatcc_008963 [Talaromyces marneffei ATCC 18224]|uniref:Uncharacterized protein n=2 Tax=Talaromyces marneffei TaxID=37727 RepID=B6QKI6_TALMQ|nr:uncharacterized protein EYB26_008269 [Talaromyces marneffei]EEA21613.1 hypothetical protein PMAA_054140 [Talaromyces marneffei ATCC 18224]KAE8550898.1 hypothetical protein EYB25_007130 [Talaromyces marneffei]QGA20563.1 hypothetical protein EYB26_008269 [Talaromyces marneffei]
MGIHEGNRDGQYFQLTDEEQSIGSEKTRIGNDDQESEHDGGLYYDVKELKSLRRPAHDGTRRYRFLVGCVTTLTLIFSILQLLAILRGGMHIPHREEVAPNQSLEKHEPETTSSSNFDWPCGISAEEAKKAGCYFDMGLIAWLPHACYNKELDESFRALNDWPFWLPNDENTGPNLTKPITVERLQDLPLQMVDLDWPGHSWSTLMFHDAHCLHAWQYMHQALLKNKKIPTSITRWSHTTHCSHEALMDTSNVTYREISPTAHNRYPACVEVDSMKGQMPDLY